MRKSSKSKGRVLSSKLQYEGPLFNVYTEYVKEPSGVETRRDIVRHSGSIVVLAVKESRTGPLVLLENQYRHSAQQYLWELPAGRIDPGEKPLPAAKRELLEETGYSASRWKRILHFYATPGFVAEAMSIYMASGLKQGIAQPEADEIIHHEMVPLTKAVRMIMNGTIADAKTICGVLWLAQQRKNRRPA